MTNCQRGWAFKQGCQAQLEQNTTQRENTPRDMEIPIQTDLDSTSLIRKLQRFQAEMNSPEAGHPSLMANWKAAFHEIKVGGQAGLCLINLERGSRRSLDEEPGRPAEGESCAAIAASSGMGEVTMVEFETSFRMITFRPP